MSTLQVENDDEGIILVDLVPAAGVRSVSLTPKDLVEKSKEAMEHAMKTVRRMAKKTMKTVKAIPVSERPTTFEVQFGIKLNAEGNALVTKAGGEATMNITLTWEHKSKAK
jgi:hypothetical protein